MVIDLAAMSTPVLDQFLQEVGKALSQRNGPRLQDILQLEPPLPPIYMQLIQELKTNYPSSSEQALVTKCEQTLQPIQNSIGSAWGGFSEFLSKYFRFLRDGDPNDLGDLYERLRSLTNQSIIVLSDTANGVIILPMVLYLSRVLAKVALGLDKNPDLVKHLLDDRQTTTGEGATEKVTFVESSANVLREAFIKCLSDKSGSGGLSGVGRRGKPENKRTGIYMTANSCFKLLFQCRKLRNAQQMFVSIDAQSPLLEHYPAAQRVTYLYYLGRYLFANRHFYRAQLALSSAYGQCHAQASKQRQLILTYLIASNICLGRFPASKLLLRGDAADLARRFLPLCRIIAKGDIAEFVNYLSLESESGQWFLRKRLLLQLRDSCEILVWRSLVRKVFACAGFIPPNGDNKMPVLRLHYVRAAAQWLRNGRNSSQPPQPNTFGTPSPFGLAAATTGKPHDPVYTDPEFVGLDDAVAETNFNIDTGIYHDPADFAVHNPTASNGGATDDPSPTMAEVESILASLLQQGFLHGFLLHVSPRFAIPGSKGRSPLEVGFPNVWKTISARADDEVPGWVKETSGPPAAAAFGGAGGGRVVNLSGARPVGAGP